MLGNATEISWAPYIDGPGRLAGAYVRHGLTPLRVIVHMDPQTLVLLRVSRRTMRAAGPRIEAGEAVQLSYAGRTIRFTPESPLVYVVTGDEDGVHARIYRANLLNAVRPLL